jgi:uncharacterized protein
MEALPELNYKLLPELAELGSSKLLSGKLPLDSLLKGSQDFRFDGGGIDYQLELSNTGGGVLLQGTVAAKCSTECARCLEPAEYLLEGEVEGYYITNPSRADELYSDDEFVVIGTDGLVDLAVPILAAVVYELPMVVLCKEDCAGLCPSCGTNLNVKDCGCLQRPDADHPFAVLKQLME